MLSPTEIDELYKNYCENLMELAHDGIMNVDLGLLHELGILDALHEDNEDPNDLTQYFHVIESVEKVTLFNDQFLIWIIPKMEEEIPITYVMIAMEEEEKMHLEIVFTTAGVYNTPQYVLKVLQHFIVDMLDTEATLMAIEKNQ